MHQVIRSTACYNFERARLPLKTNFSMPYWQARLADYHDQDLLQFLTFGWPINFTSSSVVPVGSATNHPSALNFPQHVQRFLETELSHLALLGPFVSNPFPSTTLTVSPMQTVPKKGSPGARRVVVDLSFPQNLSVNSGIPRHEYLQQSSRFHLPSIDAFIALIQCQGQGCFLYKRDLSRAYRQIPVDPHDYNLLGIQWRNQLFFDTALPFGLRSAAFICQRFSSALAYMHKSDGFDSVNYIDDFAGAESSYRSALQASLNLSHIFHLAGVTEAHDKAVLPTTDLTFLGVGFNTTSFHMYVPEDKLRELRDLSFLVLSRKKISKRQLQSIVGKLMFAAKCVIPARVFMNRLLSALRKLTSNSHRIRVSLEMKRDLRWWHLFLPRFNGRCLIPRTLWSEPDSVLQCDACPSGAGGLFLAQAFHSQFPEFILSQNLHINALELLVVTVAVKLWADQLRGQKVTIYCDNTASVAVINSGSSRDEFMQACLRELVYYSALHDFQIRAEHLISRRQPHRGQPQPLALGP